MKQIDILAIGEPLIEMIRRDGVTHGPATYTSDVGGDVLNALVAAARQGASTGLISAVGDDPFGQHIKAFCATEGIDTSMLKVSPEHSTGLCFIDPDPSDRNFTYVRRGSAASSYGADALQHDMIAKAQALHVTGVSQAIGCTMRRAVRVAAEIAKANGTLVSYDLNLRLKLWPLEEARGCIDDFLPFADIVLPSEDEAKLLLGSDSIDAILDYFAQHDAEIIVLKRAKRGVIVRTANKQVAIEAPTVKAVDSSGAGDSFAGSFLAYLLETNDPIEAARRAVRVAAITVTGHGATPAIPRRESIVSA
jgi:2-dehydro-3-deoxygluconokinase